MSPISDIDRRHVHALALWAVLQVRAVRQAVRENVPLSSTSLPPNHRSLAPRGRNRRRRPFVVESPPAEPAPAGPAPVVEVALAPLPKVMAFNASNLLDKTYVATCLSRGDCWWGARRNMQVSVSHRF